MRQIANKTTSPVLAKPKNLPTPAGDLAPQRPLVRAVRRGFDSRCFGLAVAIVSIGVLSIPLGPVLRVVDQWLLPTVVTPAAPVFDQIG